MSLAKSGQHGEFFPLRPQECSLLIFIFFFLPNIFPGMYFDVQRGMANDSIPTIHPPSARPSKSPHSPTSATSSGITSTAKQTTTHNPATRSSCLNSLVAIPASLSQPAGNAPRQHFPGHSLLKQFAIFLPFRACEGGIVNITEIHFSSHARCASTTTPTLLSTDAFTGGNDIPEGLTGGRVSDVPPPDVVDIAGLSIHKNEGRPSLPELFPLITESSLTRVCTLGYSKKLSCIYIYT